MLCAHAYTLTKRTTRAAVTTTCTRATVSMPLSGHQHPLWMPRGINCPISIDERGENHGEQEFVPSEHEHTPETVNLGEVLPLLLSVAGPRAPRRSHGHYGVYVACTIGKS